MARLILKSPYLKGNQKGASKKYVEYIAKREGVEFVSDTTKHLPATYRQKEMIQSLLKDVPDSRDLHEYADYLEKPTRENASELISTAIELGGDLFKDRPKYLKYISERPRVEKVGKHGLFTDEGKPVVISQVQKDIDNHSGNIWFHIISLKREDAERLGYNNAKAWMNLLRANRNMIAQQMNIKPENFRWYAAFHNESHHPHVHLVAYSSNPQEPYLSKQGIENIKSALAKEIFKNERMHIYEEQTSHRDELKQVSAETVKALVEQIQNGESSNLEIENKLKELSKRLSKLSGKMQYGYLDKSHKVLVDSIVDELEKDDRISSLYNLWYEQKYELLRIYTDTLPAKIPISQNPVFKSIKNMIIKEALLIHFTEKLGNTDNSIEEENDEAEPTESEIEIEAPIIHSEEYNKLYANALKGNHWAQYKLAKYLRDEKNPEFNPPEAVKWFTESAHRGNEIAMYMLGKIYVNADLVEKNVEEGIKWLQTSADTDNSYAQYLLGKIYLQGKETDPDYDKAYELLGKSASHENRYALFTLGKALLQNKPFRQDLPKALEYISSSAEHGFTHAQYLYGKMLYEGKIIGKDVPKALEMLESADKQKNANASYLLGKIYLYDESISDPQKAMEYFLKAEQEGNTFADYQIGKMYLYGIGVEKDLDTALAYLSKSSENGNNYAKQLLGRIENNRNSFMASSSITLLHHLGRIIQNKIHPQDRTSMAVRETAERKELIEENEKKAAHGLKPEM